MGFILFNEDADMHTLEQIPAKYPIYDTTLLPKWASLDILQLWSIALMQLLPKVGGLYLFQLWSIALMQLLPKVGSSVPSLDVVVVIHATY